MAKKSDAPAAAEPATTDTPAAPDQPAATPARRGAVRAPQRTRLSFTEEQRVLIRRLVCTSTDKPDESATDDEFDGFMATCERLQLDPLARQIHFMKRGGQDKKVGRAEVSIDGFRLIAERTGDYAGQTPRQWADVQIQNGRATMVWYDVWPFPTLGNGAKFPLAARVGVHRVGFAEPLYAVARWDAYKQTKFGGGLNRMWEKMGPEQLGKCAEALALRQGFPNELSGVYTPDEMGQADDDGHEAKPARAARTDQQQATDQQQGGGQQQQQLPPPPHPLAIPAGEVVSNAFPYGKFARVPLAAKWTATTVATDRTEDVGQYVIPIAKLQEAEAKASARYKKLHEAGGHDDEVAELEKVLAELTDEMGRRAEEDEAAAKQNEEGAAP